MKIFETSPEEPRTDEEAVGWHRGWASTPKDVDELWQYIGDLALNLGSHFRFVWRGLDSAEHLITSTLYRELQELKKICDVSRHR